MDFDDFLNDSTLTPTPTITLSLGDQKSYLIKNVDSLSIEQRRSLGQVLTSCGKKSLLQMNAQGTLVNLNLVPDNVVTAMYEYMRDQLTNQ